MPKSIGENLAILRDFGLVPEQSALILGVKRRQVYRWEAAEAYPNLAEQERLVMVVTIIERLRQVYNDEQAMCWMLRPNDSMSGGRSPYRAMLAGAYGAALSVAKADVLAAKSERDGVSA